MHARQITFDWMTTREAAWFIILVDSVRLSVRW